MKTHVLLRRRAGTEITDFEGPLAGAVTKNDPFLAGGARVAGDEQTHQNRVHVQVDGHRVMKSVAFSLCLAFLVARVSMAQVPPWVAPMKSVHARFTGQPGTLAHFGDSITVTMAYWAPVADKPRNMDDATARGQARVKSYLRPECWRSWKGPKFGSDGRMTVRWAHVNVDAWLKALNPEVVVIMFGSNDVGDMELAEYETKLREVVQRCLRNGTIVILTTPPPRHGRVEKSRFFAAAARKIAREEQLPVIDYAAEILQRRPDDWDGALPQFKNAPGDEYQVPTLMARDGVHPSNPTRWVNDFSADGLKHNGYGLRNYLTLIAYAQVVGNVLQPATER